MMEELHSKPNNICAVPTEILFNIFSFLPVKESMRCRQVCRRWKAIIDDLACKNDWWVSHCKKEFKKYYWTAKRKAKSDLDGFNLFRSMSLWSKLAETSEVYDEFAVAHEYIEEVRSVEVLENGVLSVLKKCGMYYYDSGNLEYSPRAPIVGDYTVHAENDSVTILVDYRLVLIIYPRIPNVDHEPAAMFTSIKIFHLTSDYLYFVNLLDEIYRCELSGEFKPTFLQQAKKLDGVLALNFTKGFVNILTYGRKLYTLVKSQFILQHTLTRDTNIIDVLNRYNMLNYIDWKVYFQFLFANYEWMRRTNNVVIIKSFGDVFILGTDVGYLQIYYRPLNPQGEVDLFNCAPVKQINFMFGYMNMIRHIDVLETENGHTVYVAMPKKVGIIKFNHRSQRQSWQMSDEDDMEQ